MTKMKFYSLWISLVLIIVFVIQLLIPGFTELFLLTNNALSMPWQFLTAIFLHGGVAHLFYNLFALLLFGLILEKLIGSNKFLFIFLISGIIANLFSFTFYPSSLGASGAIMGIIGTIAVLRPMMIVWAFNLPMPMFLLAIIWVVGSIMGIFGIGDSNTGHLAHLSGIAIGILSGLILRLSFRNGKNSYSVVLNRKIQIPEEEMQRWENWYMK